MKNTETLTSMHNFRKSKRGTIRRDKQLKCRRNRLSGKFACNLGVVELLIDGRDWAKGYGEATEKSEAR